MMEYFLSYQWLPFAFMVLLAIAVLVYVILDGYDLGVGMLMSRATPKERDNMISSIGPFWDANETWLVLAVGILLVAFPKANGMILTSLYIPVAIMLCGLILRGVSFDFRAKAHDNHKKAWNFAFIGGSFVTSFSQGFMLGAYIMGFHYSFQTILFSIVCGICLCFGYCLLGASWLVWKMERELQKKSIKWARKALYGTIIGMLIISTITPLTSTRIFDKWFAFPNVFFLSIMPIFAFGICLIMISVLKKLPTKEDKLSFLPFVLTIALFIICFQGIAYSFYPYIVPGKLLIMEAAISQSSLLIMFIGAVAIVPFIIGYTIFTYWVFRGKASELHYH